MPGLQLSRVTMERRVMEAIGYPGDNHQFIVSLAWVIAMLAASMLLGMMLAVACFFLQEAVPSNRRESERSPPHDALMHVVLLAVGMTKGTSLWAANGSHCASHSRIKQPPGPCPHCDRRKTHTTR